jgi:tetratricopeptide (TPR) repeat protein
MGDGTTRLFDLPKRLKWRVGPICRGTDDRMSLLTPIDESPDSLAERGLALARTGELDAAIAALTEAVRLRPDFARAHHNLGIAMAERGRLEEAVRSLQAALDLDPAYVDAHYNLGAILDRLGSSEASFASYWRAHELRPDHVDTLNNLGLALIARHRSDEAVALLKHALRLRPNSRTSLNNLGLAFVDVGEYECAVDCYETALKSEPRALDVLSNLPAAYKEAGNLKRALAHYDLAARLYPEQMSIRWNRALCLLQMGDYERGWAEYECRRQKNDHEMLSFLKPYWDGEPLSGRTILLHAEQGRGDAIQFIRYARRIPRDGGRVVFFAPRDLALLFRKCPGIDLIVVDGNSIPDFDVHASILSLPHLLRRPLPDDEVPYLAPDPVPRAIWRARFDAMTGYKIGIAWQGNPKHRNDHHRSLPLRLFGVLSELPAIALVSLQRGIGTEQIGPFRDRHRLAAFDRIEDDGAAFADLAAMIAELSLVVTVDTAVAHLAGALGVRTLVATSAHSDWRWQLGRADTDWYPTMRLIRQQRLDDWRSVMSEIVRIVADHAVGAKTAFERFDDSRAAPNR